MDLSNPLIINTEVFFNCAGNCKGCFLTNEERISSNFFIDNVKNKLLQTIQMNPSFSHLIVGFGRGNLLLLNNSNLQKLLGLIEEINSIVGYNRVTFELSTSLIGKIDAQVELAKSIINRVRNCYFNVVINSEITSSNFWKNWKTFYSSLFNERVKFGFTDFTGDILVLNINPSNLPDLTLLDDAIGNINSPINISLFPFEKSNLTEIDFNELNKWSKDLFLRFKDKDLNINNFLKQLEVFNPNDFSMDDILKYKEQNSNSYVFIDYNGDVTKGSLSIMGELDFPRFAAKYGVNVSSRNIIKTIAKSPYCNQCPVLNQCILTNAIYNKVVNSEKYGEMMVCQSGYKDLFVEFNKSKL